MGGKKVKGEKRDKMNPGLWLVRTCVHSPLQLRNPWMVQSVRPAASKSSGRPSSPGWKLPGKDFSFRCEANPTPSYVLLVCRKSWTWKYPSLFCRMAFILSRPVLYQKSHKWGKCTFFSLSSLLQQCYLLPKKAFSLFPSFIEFVSNYPTFFPLTATHRDIDCMEREKRKKKKYSSLIWPLFGERLENP